MKNIFRNIAIEKNDILNIAGHFQRHLLDDIRDTSDVPVRQLCFRSDSQGVFGSMPALSQQIDLYINKIATLVKNNEIKKNSVEAILTAFSVQTGELLGVFDGKLITNLKCAAVVSLMTSLLLPKQIRTISLVGAGNLGKWILRGILETAFVSEIKIYSKTKESSRSLSEELSQIYPQTRFLVCETLSDVLENCEILCTATTSFTPLFSHEDLRSTKVIFCMGAHTSNEREIPVETLKESILVVEDKETAVLEAGSFHREAFQIESLLKNEILSGEHRRVIFSSTGHALYDLLTTDYLLKNRIEVEEWENSQT